MFAKRKLGLLFTFLLLLIIIPLTVWSVKNLRFEIRKKAGTQFLQKQILIPENKEGCEAKSGKWGKIGFDSKKQCNLPTSDGGKECLNSKECEGNCIAESPKDKNGKCTFWKITVGCFYPVEKGIVKDILCTD